MSGSTSGWSYVLLESKAVDCSRPKTFQRARFWFGWAVIWSPQTELADLIAEADADPDAPYVDTITVNEDAHLVMPGRTRAHFGNHSCDPNAWHVGPYEIAARRDIRTGDEVTIDYGTASGAPGFSMICNCGSDLCRREVTSDEWRRVELQARYGDHWVPALLERISAS